jgi:hypothetical protein
MGSEYLHPVLNTSGPTIKLMRDRNNQLKHIPPQAFTIIQSFREEFIRDLADIPTWYQTGNILYLSQYMKVPVLMVKEEHQDRIAFQQTSEY